VLIDGKYKEFILNNPNIYLVNCEKSIKTPI